MRRLHIAGPFMFRDLAPGDRFHFDRTDLPPGNGLASGPWVKRSARTYTHATHGGHYRVGTVRVGVVRAHQEGFES